MRSLEGAATRALRAARAARMVPAKTNASCHRLEGRESSEARAGDAAGTPGEQNVVVRRGRPKVAEVQTEEAGVRAELGEELYPVGRRRGDVAPAADGQAEVLEEHHDRGRREADLARVGAVDAWRAPANSTTRASSPPRGGMHAAHDRPRPRTIAPAAGGVRDPRGARGSRHGISIPGRRATTGKERAHADIGETPRSDSGVRDQALSEIAENAILPGYRTERPPPRRTGS